MKSTHVFIVLAAGTVLWLAATGSSQLFQGKPTVVAVVSIEEVWLQIDAREEMNAELQGRRDAMLREKEQKEKEINNLEIVEMIAEIFELYPHYKLVDFHSSRPGHDLRYSLDGTKLREHGWNAPMTLEESFERTVNWTLKHPEWLAE